MTSSIPRHRCHPSPPSSSASLYSARRRQGGSSQLQPRHHLQVLLVLSAALISSTVVGQSQPQPNPCIRYAHSSTIGASQSNSAFNSTLYIYGGDAKTSIGQTTNTRTNALVALDLTKNWSISNPPLSLVKPANDDNYDPPKTSLGGMFSSSDGRSLFYYGGYFSDNPDVAPDGSKLYEYSVASSSWSTVSTSGDSVERSAGGAAAVTPAENGSSQPNFFYFGGHLDSYTTPGWSNQIPRIYLDSIVEYDQSARSWTNHTTSASSGGRVSDNSTTETAPLLRGDSTLTYVPGMGTDSRGILVNVGGGNLNQLTDNNLLDVYDIGSKSWVRQATQGYTMTPRVSHCAVRGSAKVNSKLQHAIFVYGGQPSNRTTQMAQGQNSDVYILLLPSFTWHYMGDRLPSAPPGRAGHTCALVGSQLIVVGGYVSDDLICEQPGVFVFDTNEAKWTTQYTANTVFTIPNVPEVVAVTGGRGTGSSTSGSGYAFGTGAEDVDTSSQFGGKDGGSNGGDQTQDTTGNSNSSPGGKGSSNTGAIVGGVVGGVLGGLLLAALAFLGYRRRQRRKEGREGIASAAGSPGREREKAETRTSMSTSPGTRASEQQNPYEQDFASDDIEEEMAGYNAQYSRLVPKSSLRVVNV